MPKRTKKNRYMKKGGDIIGTPPPTAQNLSPTQTAPTSSVSDWVTGAFTGAKKAMSSAASSVSSAATSATSALQNTVSPPQRTFGGKRRRKGGEMLATPIQTAQPQVWVGGKTRKRSCNKRHKHTKSCKSKTNKKGNRKKRSRKSKFPFSESLKRLIKM
jgi:hypothetical protein